MNNTGIKKLNNAGISLIELVIVVAILVVIAIPFTHAFVTAANTNAKSQKTLRATTICENAMEIFKSITPEEARDRYDNHEAIANVSYDTTTGVWTYKLTGDQIGEVNADDYDIEITLDPSSYSSATYDSTDPSSSYNSQNVTDIEAITADNSGVYSMSLTHEPTVLSYYRSYRATLTEDDFNRNYSRRLTLKVTKLGEKINAAGERVPIVKVEVEIKYEAPASAGIPGNDKYFTDTVEIFNNMTTEKPLNSVYLFYIPRYDCLSGDPIYIENEGNVPFTCYVVRGNRGVTDAGVDQDAAKLPSYNAKIYVTEKSRTSNFANISLRTNLYNMTDDILTSRKYYTLKYTETFSGTDYNNSDSETYLKIRSADGRSFTSAGIVNRIYSMTVTVKYKGSVLATMTGTKTN